MNYLTNVKNVTKLSQQELQNTSKTSWHDQYKDSAWIFIGGLPDDLTEGDIICIFSQYGEVVNINLIRAKDTGKSKGFCFLCYEDQCSTVLAVDNFNGIKILNRTIRVDHVQDYKVSKDDKKANEETKKLYAEGCAPKAAPIVPKIEPVKQNLRETLADQIEGDIKLPARLPIYTTIKGEKISDTETEIAVKKGKKKKKSKKKSQKSDSNSDESDLSESEADAKFKKERQSSEERDRRNRKSGERIDKPYSTESRSSSSKDSPYKNQKYAEYCSSKTIETNRYSPKRSCRSRSIDRNQKGGTSKRDISPNIPKRWR